jgi:DNA-binding NarL/FixJ family response regulator
MQHRTSLTPREFQIVECIALDRTTRQTAAMLKIKPRSVNELIYRAYRKLGIDATRNAPRADPNGRGGGHRDWVEKRAQLKARFLRQYPSCGSRRQGYLQACVRVARSRVRDGVP